MTTAADPANELTPDEVFGVPAGKDQLIRAATALATNGFIVEVLDGPAEARRRVSEIVPPGATVFAAASETLRLSGIADDIDASGQYQSVRTLVRTMDRATQARDIRRLTSAPDVVIGSVAAVTESGSLLAVSATGSQLPAYSGGADKTIWIVGAQKVVRDLPTAFRRIESYAYPLEDARARAAYGQATRMHKILILNGDHLRGRSTVLLLREAIGF
jgi:hypothetical protein